MSGQAMWSLSGSLMNDADRIAVKGGMGNLVQELAIGLNVQTNAQVEEITLRDNGVEVTWSGSMEEGRRRRNREEADAVLVTLPLGVLKHSLMEPASPTAVRFTPPLPEQKQASIRRLGFGLINKVVLTFEKIFWDPNIHVYGHINQEKGHRGELYLFWNESGSEGCGSLVGFVGGESGEWGERVADNIVVGRALKVLADIFGPSSVPYPKDSVVTRWRSDPWSRGSTTYIAKDASEVDVAELSEPILCKAGEGGVFFGGEATSAGHVGTLEGAALSGLREAGRIAHALLPSNYAP